MSLEWNYIRLSEQLNMERFSETRQEMYNWAKIAMAYIPFGMFFQEDRPLKNEMHPFIAHTHTHTRCRPIIHYKGVADQNICEISIGERKSFLKLQSFFKKPNTTISQ